MNKVVPAAVVILLGAGYLGATAWTGKQTETRYREQLAQVQARLPFVSITEQKYDKHFFTSTSTTTLQFGCPSGAGKALPTATVTSTIRHGPIAGAAFAAAVVDTQIRIAAGSDDAQRLIAAFGTGAPLTAHTVVGFGGSSNSTVASPAAKVPLGSGAELDWQGLSGDIGSSSDGRTVTYRIKSPGLTLADPAHQASMRVGALSLQGEGRAIGATAGPYMVGTAQGSLETVAISGGSGASQFKAAFNGLALSSATALEGETIGGTSSFTGTGTIGDVKLDKIEMKMSLKRLHAASYQRVMETFTKELYRCDAPTRTPDLAALQAKIQGDLMTLLRHSPEMSIDRIAVESGGQTGELSYGIGIEGVTEADASLPMPALVMAHARAHAATRVPVAWLRQLAQASAAKLQGGVPDPSTLDVMLDNFQAQGYVVRDGDYVKSELSFAKGALSVNGKPLGPK